MYSFSFIINTYELYDYGEEMNKKITSRDVAKAAGVSQSLVSLILNQIPDKKIKAETRDRVLDTARRLNYTVNMNARNMKNKKAGAIGLLSTWDAHSFVFPPVIKGVQAFCAEKNTGVVICSGKIGLSGNPDYVDYYLQNRIDGLIYVSYVGVRYEGVIQEMTNKEIPFVCIIGARDLPGVSCVDVSFLESGYLAAGHLASKGYKAIGFISSMNIREFCYAKKERYEGVRKVCLEEGLDLAVHNIFGDALDEETMIQAAKEFLKQGSCDAIAATSYSCFIMLKAAAMLGFMVPQVLGVISLDNELYAPFLFPSLTTVDEPLFDIAIKATSILFEKMSGDKVCKKLELMPCMSERESTGR